MQSNVVTVILGEDGEYYLVGPAINQMGWDEDTLIEWIDNEDGTYNIREVNNAI